MYPSSPCSCLLLALAPAPALQHPILILSGFELYINGNIQKSIYSLVYHFSQSTSDLRVSLLPIFVFHSFLLYGIPLYKYTTTQFRFLCGWTLIDGHLGIFHLRLLLGLWTQGHFCTRLGEYSQRVCGMELLGPGIGYACVQLGQTLLNSFAKCVYLYTIASG